MANGMFIISGLLVILYNEHFEFAYHQSSQWSTAVEALPAKSPKNVRILFVADPQLKGSHDGAIVLGSFMNWDADRYLTKYFRLAMSAVKPNVVVFMGDMLGQDGLMADDDEFTRYAERFKTMFSVPDSVLVSF